MRFGRAAVARFGIGVTDMDGVKMVGEIVQRFLRLFGVFRARFENLRAKSGETLLIPVPSSGEQQSPVFFGGLFAHIPDALPEIFAFVIALQLFYTDAASKASSKEP